jgi:phosphoglycerol transferase MdoB-like AlkP superfamily enzyme
MKEARVSAIEAPQGATLAQSPLESRLGVWLTAGLGILWALFLYDTEPDWFNFLPVAAIYLALTALVFALTKRWRFAALSVAFVFLFINAAARVKFAMVAMALHIFDVMFHASLTQAAFFYATFPKIAWGATLAVALGGAALVWLWKRERPVGWSAGWRLGALGLVWLAAAPTMPIFSVYGADYFHDHRHGLSAFFNSFRDLPALWRHVALVETGPLPETAAEPPPIVCKPGEKPPHIVLFLSESTMPPGVYPNLPFPEETKPFFTSADGAIRRLRVETFGGATWLTDFASLTGLSTRDLGSMYNFVMPFMTGRLRHALPQYLSACGYDTSVIYPVPGEFGGTGRFYKSVGFDTVVDQHLHKAPTDQERDAFYYGQAIKRIEAGRAAGRPQFVALSSMGTHAPWDFRLDPKALKPGERTTWTGDAEMDEYFWRLVLAARDREAFKKELAAKFPGEKFLIVAYGDHQPALKKLPLRDAAEMAGDGKWTELSPVAKAFETYYQIDGVNYAPKLTKDDGRILDISNLSTVLIEAARLPRDEYVERRLELLKVCNGLYATCGDRQAVVDFQTWMVARGWLAGK